MRNWRVVTTWFVLLHLALATSGGVSPASADEPAGLTTGQGADGADGADLIRGGITALQAGDYSRALRTFERASETDMAPAARFFMGVAYNRLGQPRQALRELDRAQAMGASPPERHFERGWALLRMEMFEQAADELEAHEARFPGQAKTSEMLGRAWFGLGDHDRAREHLEEAIRRDPSVEPTARLTLALLEDADRNPAASRRQLALLADLDDPLATAVRDRMGLTGQAPADKPWRVQLSLGLGYNSNVIAIGDGVPLPADISDAGSATGRLGAGLAVDVLRLPADTVTIGYALRADVFEDELKVANYVDNYFYARWLHRFNDAWTSSFLVADSLSHVDERLFRNQVTVRPALSQRVGEAVRIDYAYTLAVNEYNFPTTTVTDRDSLTHGFDLGVLVAPPTWPVRFLAGYRFELNLADGDDYDYRSHQVSVGVAADLGCDVTGEVRFARSFVDYQRDNSFTGFTRIRHDDVNLVQARLSRPLGEHVTVRVDYLFIDNDSNIGFFRYDQHVVLAGLDVSF